ncbi:MAG: hypothetical protein JOZ29_07945 [Deltaproteobacteria bacterium]|nr:hypothetical protein [Deltaproteobacteria bacterium]
MQLIYARSRDDPYRVIFCLPGNSSVRRLRRLSTKAPKRIIHGHPPLRRNIAEH